MNIHEHQAKEILKEFGAPVSKGVVIYNLNETRTWLYITNHNKWLNNHNWINVVEEIENKLSIKLEDIHMRYGNNCNRINSYLFALQSSWAI